LRGGYIVCSYWVVAAIGVRVCRLVLILSRCRLLSNGRGGVYLGLLAFFTFLLLISKALLLQISEVVVKDKVSVLLLRQKERLDKLLPWLAVVGHFTNDVNHDAIIGTGMSIDRVDEHFAFLEFDFEKLFVNGCLALQKRGFFALNSVKIMGILGVESVELIGFVVHICIILNDELPGHLGHCEIVGNVSYYKVGRP
jgi:hypothetical protein